MQYIIFPEQKRHQIGRNQANANGGPPKQPKIGQVYCPEQPKLIVCALQGIVIADAGRNAVKKLRQQTVEGG